MSLEIIITTKTQKDRKLLLSNYLKNNGIGELSESESKHFKQIFSKYYSPDEGEDKFNPWNISIVSIDYNGWNNKNFNIKINNNWYPTSIQRLSGGNKNEKSNLTRALRQAIEDQIQNFRNTNTLNPFDTCPVIPYQKLDIDAQVDHTIPFHKLKDCWMNVVMNTDEKIKYSYNLDKMNYVLDSPWCEYWQTYHLNNAKLRWVSKEGNKIAHLEIP